MKRSLWLMCLLLCAVMAHSAPVWAQSDVPPGSPAQSVEDPDSTAPEQSPTQFEPPAQAANPLQFRANFGWDLRGSYRMVSYDQQDPRWGSRPYGRGKRSIAAAGCGPAALAMVGATLLREPRITPLRLANRYGRRYHVNGQGSAHALVPRFGRDYGFQVRFARRNLRSVREVLQQGGLVVALVGPGHFTGGGHFIVLRGYRNGRFYVADSNRRNNHKEGRGYSASFLRTRGGLNKLWTFELP